MSKNLSEIFRFFRTKTGKFGQTGVSKGGQYVAASLKSYAGNTKGGSIIVPLTSCLTGLESAV